ncbi:MAG: alpha-L-fucosidase [Pirellulaceae bacterium]|nr:alpha-L-fucosidase [Pirellulaceae bacterium]
MTEYLHRMTLLASVLLGCLVDIGQGAEPGPADPPKFETQQQHDARMRWWREARFGMFIHWGIYSVPAGVLDGEIVDANHGAEWIQCDALLTPDQYQPYAQQFNPVQFDADQWVRIAKDAGMKYMVITSKHHDGFSMYGTQASRYNIVDATPYKKDPLLALSQACKRHGITFGVYYSQLDWHHPAQVNNKSERERLAYRYRDIRPGRKQEYIEDMKLQLRELITDYDVQVIFFDGEWVRWWTQEDGRDLEAFCRSLNPNMVINNRVGKRKREDGDYGTPEQRIPDTGPGYDWETCMTMNGTWGYKSYDHDWKSTEDLIRKLVDIASKGGNFLLNVGPTAGGIIPQPSVDRLAAMGDWLEVNGDSIYATTASPFEKPDWGRYTKKPGKLFAHVFDWPEDKRLSVPVPGDRVDRVYLLSKVDHLPLSIVKSPDRIVVTLPATPPDLIDSVVVIQWTE